MENVILDKTGDGRYWTLHGWTADDRAVRLRFSHTTFQDPSDMQAEVGIWDEEASLVVWTQLGRPFLFALGSPDFEEEDSWTHDFPETCRDVLVELARVLGVITRHLDLGPALGQMALERRAQEASGPDDFR